MTLLEDLRDANEVRLLGEVLARSESFWALTEARLSSLDPKPVGFLERVGNVLRRVRAARIELYPRTAEADVQTFRTAWTEEQGRKLGLALLAEEQRLTEIGVSA